jgi:xylulokinase
VDAEDWWRAAIDCVPQLLASTGVRPDAIAAVGVTGAMHALVPVGADGAVLAPTLTWFDQRCRPQAERLREQHAAAFEAVGGVSVFASSARLRWLRETSSAVIGQTRCFLLPKDFLRFRLTGRFATDPSDARNTSMVDRGTGDWSRALVEGVLEVPAAKLPEIRPGCEIAGPVTGAAAAALGVKEGTPVAVGMGDVPCTLLGVNAFRAGQLALYLGTGLWMARTLDSDNDWEPRTAWAGSTLSGGSAFLWARRLLQPDEAAGSPPDYRAIEQALASVPPGADGLLFLPHLMGERGRCGDPDARGVFFGLTLAHTPAHLQRAVVEGIAFQVRREIEAAASAQATAATHPEHRETAWQAGPQDPITLSGAAARSGQWRQIVADVTGRPVTVPAVADTTALGAALVAAIAVGHFSSPRTGAAAWVRPGPTVQPSEQVVAIYEAAYKRFCALEEALQPLYSSFAKGRSSRF